jgi:hypothetical protein
MIVEEIVPILEERLKGIKVYIDVMPMLPHSVSIISVSVHLKIISL